MRLERMGAAFPTRLSFMRSLLRRMGREGWRVTRERFDLDDQGFGTVVYRATTPERVYSLIGFSHDLDPAMRTDRLASAILDFGTGTSTFTCSTQLVPYQRVNILGTEGRVEIEIPFNAPPDRPCKIWLQKGRDQIEELTIPICDQYTIQGDLFALAILNNTPVPTPIEDAVANMKVIEAVHQSGRDNSWVALPGK